MALQKIAHAIIRVKNLEQSIDFHTKAWGLHEVARQDGMVFFGCSGDSTFDVAITEGGTGIIAAAFSADDESDLEYYKARLQEAGVSVTEKSDPLPAIRKMIEFSPPGLPQKVQIVLQQPKIPQYYYNPAWNDGVYQAGVFRPLDLDHLVFIVPGVVDGAVDFFTKVLGFKVSDAAYMPDGAYVGAFMRISQHHHDFAVFAGQPQHTLNHLSWDHDGIEHMKAMYDQVMRYGNVVREAGLGRHGVGSNLYAYFRTPCGNRYELSAEMPFVYNHSACPKKWVVTDPGFFSVWGEPFPESFRENS